MVEVGGFLGEGGGVCFEGEFFEGLGIEGVFESVDEFGEVGRGEHRGSSAAEIDRGEGREGVFSLLVLRFVDEGINKDGEVSVAGGVFVKRAIGADAMAEGNVEVEVHG